MTQYGHVLSDSSAAAKYLVANKSAVPSALKKLVVSPLPADSEENDLWKEAQRRVRERVRQAFNHSPHDEKKVRKRRYICTYLVTQWSIRSIRTVGQSKVLTTITTFGPWRKSTSIATG